jgi:hypothetical protein
MHMEMSGIVMNAVGVSDRIVGMIYLVESSHDLLHRRMKDLVGVDARIGQRIVLFLRHGKHESMSDHGTLRSRRKFHQMLAPGFGNALFALHIGELRGRRARPVRIDSDTVMQESASVDLSERFLRRVVGEVLELFADLLIHVGSLTKRNFPTRSFVKIFQVEAASGSGLVGKDLSVFHIRDSRS